MALQLWTRRNETGGGDRDLVFTADRSGRIVQTNLTRRVLKPAIRRAGVGHWVTFHTFRHSCATILFRRGWNVVQVQKFLGHADSATTMRVYIHLLDEDFPEPDFMDSVSGALGSNVVSAAESLRLRSRPSDAPTAPHRLDR
jgi:integrase